MCVNRFFIGSNVMDWPLQALRAHDEGHQICVHTWSHQYMTALSNEVVFAELYYTQKAIKAVLGVTPQCWYVGILVELCEAIANDDTGDLRTAMSTTEFV